MWELVYKNNRCLHLDCLFSIISCLSFVLATDGVVFHRLQNSIKQCAQQFIYKILANRSYHG